MRITKRTSIAIQLLVFCALNEDRLVSKSEIAHCCNISENHLAQVINQLSQLDYLHTQRGRNGGMNLARSAEAIRIGDVFRDVEGELPISANFEAGQGDAQMPSGDRLKSALADAEHAFYARLDEITLDTLIREDIDLAVPTPA